MPGYHIAQLAGAKDLGLQLHYTGLARPGCLKERIDTGLRRLKNVLHQDWDMDVKIHVIRASVYAAAFHGCEVYPICVADLHKVRSLVAQCLTQDYARSQTPVLCTMFCPPKLLDPELFVIIQAIKSARQWLLHSDPDNQRLFFSMASQHVGNATTRGPASVLQEYLLRIGWTISPEGCVQVGPFTTLQLTQASMATISRWALKSWSETAIVLNSRRYKLFSFPTADVMATSEVLQKFDPSQRKILFRELAHAFQNGKQKSKWTTDDSSTCQFCNEPDDSEHRMLHCPVMAPVREQHPEAIEILTDHMPGWVDHPVVFQHALHDFITQLRERIPEPAIPEATQNLLRATISGPLILYSDGSSEHQAHPQTRFASYALVADLAANNEMRLQQADRFLATKVEPETLQTLLTGRVHGTQGIHRAELTVVVIACEHFAQMQLHTDSAVTLSAVDQVRHANAIADFCDHSEFDLLCRLFKVLRPTHQFFKIKAHVELHGHPCNLQLYHQLGNKKANDEAIHANHTLLPDVYSELRHYHADILKKKTAHVAYSVSVHHCPAEG